MLFSFSCICFINFAADVFLFGHKYVNATKMNTGGAHFVNDVRKQYR